MPPPSIVAIVHGKRTASNRQYLSIDIIKREAVSHRLFSFSYAALALDRRETEHKICASACRERRNA